MSDFFVVSRSANERDGAGYYTRMEIVEGPFVDEADARNSAHEAQREWNAAAYQCARIMPPGSVVEVNFRAMSQESIDEGRRRGTSIDW